jgi:DNA-binding NarL/FixJ family response regulator
MKPSTGNRKRRVFIVDDHPLVREWLTNLINQQSDLIACGGAASMPEALEKIMGSKPDVAVVDISLEGSSGIDLIRDLKQQCPDVVVLVLSMHEESLYAERAFRAGAKGYIMKREATRKVIDGIRRILEGGLYMSEEERQILVARFLQDGTGVTQLSHSSVEELSDRELEVLELLGNGKSAIQISETLRINVKTVHTYFARIREKMHLDSTGELLREAFRWQETPHSPP